MYWTSAGTCLCVTVTTRRRIQHERSKDMARLAARDAHHTDHRGSDGVVAMGDQTTLDLDDYTQDVEAIARMEYGPKTGQALWEDAEEFYRHNGAILHAHVRAAQVLQAARVLRVARSRASR